MKKLAILIDGGHLRICARRAGKTYNADLVANAAMAAATAGEEVFRVFYYDCPPYQGRLKLPVSGAEKEFTGDRKWLHDIAKKDLFAVRLGVLKFRGFKPNLTKQRSIRIANGTETLVDDDFKPDFEQKGVDMRIGLDIALFAQTRAVDRILLISNDTDCIPAMKYGRRAGLQVIVLGLPDQRIAPEMIEHADFSRRLESWPAL